MEDGRDDGRTENQTPISHPNKAGATIKLLFSAFDFFIDYCEPSL